MLSPSPEQIATRTRLLAELRDAGVRLEPHTASDHALAHIDFVPGLGGIWIYPARGAVDAQRALAAIQEARSIIAAVLTIPRPMAVQDSPPCERPDSQSCGPSMDGALRTSESADSERSPLAKGEPGEHEFPVRLTLSDRLERRFPRLWKFWVGLMLTVYITLLAAFIVFIIRGWMHTNYNAPGDYGDN